MEVFGLQSIGAFLVLVFQLVVGPTEVDARQFSQLKGEWTIERAVSEGTELPAADWKGKKVVFASAESKSLANSIAFSGRLRTKGRMAWLETKSVTKCSGDQLVRADEEYSTSFEVTGKTMKLLISRVTELGHRGPRPLAENKGEGGILFFLKRK